MTGVVRAYLVGIAIVSAAVTAAPAFAQRSFEQEAESLIAASLEVGSGVALARRQAAESDLPGAVATLERVQFAHPEAVAPRLLYAALLCRLDDRQGAEVEIAELAGQPIADEAWAEVTAACGAVERPRPAKKR